MPLRMSIFAGFLSIFPPIIVNRLPLCVGLLVSRIKQLMSPWALDIRVTIGIVLVNQEWAIQVRSNELYHYHLDSFTLVWPLLVQQIYRFSQQIL